MHNLQMKCKAKIIKTEIVYEQSIHLTEKERGGQRVKLRKVVTLPAADRQALTDTEWREIIIEVVMQHIIVGLRAQRGVFDYMPDIYH